MLAIVMSTNPQIPEDPMNFALSPQQQDIKERAKEFADRELAPRAAELDREDRVPFGTLEKMAEVGFMGLCVPEEYGGAGTDFLSYCLLIEELSRANAGGPYERGHAACRDVRHGGAEGAVGTVAGGRGEDRMLRPHRTRDGIRRLRDPDSGRTGRGRLLHLGAQAVGNERTDRWDHDPLCPRPRGRYGLRRRNGRRRDLLRQTRTEDGGHLRDHGRRAPRQRLHPGGRSPRGGREGAARRARHA